MLYINGFFFFCFCFCFRNCLKSLLDTAMKGYNDSGDDGDYSNNLNPINSLEEMKLCQCL